MIDVAPISGALGAELRGVDLGQDLDEATIKEIRQALLDHCVIFFRDQEFDAEQQKRLAVTGRSSRAGSAGRRAPSRSGTTAASSTSPSTTPARSGG
ncbi:MAG: TauD/TfdA family dioxygenase [Candidatus Rokubacteria bacterium]|nr:TauD/TfdA family dioxygenase [Candidatus Rokubacteria bacterium]